MQDCSYRWVLLLAMIGTLIAGCSTNPNSSARHDQSQAAPGLSTNAATEHVDDGVVQAHAHYIQGVIYDMEGEGDLALDEMSKAAAGDPSNSDLALEISRRYLEQKQPEKALGLLVRATSQPGGSGELYARLGMVYTQLGKEDQAIQACQSAIRLSPELMDGYRTLFLIDLHQGRPKDALKVLNRAAQVQPPKDAFAMELADLYVTLARQAPSERKLIVTNATIALHQAETLNTADPHVSLRLADDYNQLGDVTNASRIYLQLLDSFGDQPGMRLDLHDRLAKIYLQETDYPKAAEQLKGLVADDPDNFRAYYLLGTLAESAKQPQDALDYFQKAIILSDTFEPAYYDLAQLEIDTDKTTDALDLLDKARQKFSPSFTGEVLSALALEKEKDYTNAVTHFTSAEVIAKAGDPAKLTGGFYYDEGAAYERAGDYQQAEIYLQKSIELLPNFAEALNYLGYMWADHGTKLNEAHGLIERAVKLEPDSSAYLDSLAWVLYKLSRPQEALVPMQKAIANSEEPDATLFEHLGDIYAALKQSDKARDAWTKSLAVEPNDEVRKKLKGSTHPQP